jgi:hypothetical protein
MCRQLFEPEEATRESGSSTAHQWLIVRDPRGRLGDVCVDLSFPGRPRQPLQIQEDGAVLRVSVAAKCQ